MPGGAAAVVTGQPVPRVGGPPRVNMASCCWVASNAALSCRVSAVNAEMLSFVACEVALLANWRLCIWVWMLA